MTLNNIIDVMVKKKEKLQITNDELSELSMVSKATLIRMFHGNNCKIDNCLSVIDALDLELVIIDKRKRRNVL